MRRIVLAISGLVLLLAIVQCTVRSTGQISAPSAIHSASVRRLRSTQKLNQQQQTSSSNLYTVEEPAPAASFDNWHSVYSKHIHSHHHDHQHEKQKMSHWHEHHHDHWQHAKEKHKESHHRDHHHGHTGWSEHDDHHKHDHWHGHKHGHDEIHKHKLDHWEHHEHERKDKMSHMHHKIY